ncbi:MAG TPA: cell envelope biogenesis protein OmpA, partial [Hyphomonas adhaerens]|nr:cell envelope biogenesis protein OmpA [Hyphomonas adhaerens]
MCATAAAAFATAGLAAHAEEGWYARGDVQYGFSGDLDHDPAVSNVVGSLESSSDADENLGGQLGLGYAMANGVRLEGTLGYRGGDLDVPNDFAPGLTAVTLAPAGNLQIADLMLNGIYDFNRDGKWQPYVGLGVGAARLSAKASNLQYGTAGNLAAANGFNDSSTSLAYQGLLGLGYKVSDRLTMDFGYKYFATGDDLSFDGVPGGGTSYDGSFSEHVATVGLRYAFGA